MLGADQVRIPLLHFGTSLSGTSSSSSTRLGDFVWDSWMSEMEGVLNDPTKFETVNDLLCMILKDEVYCFS